MKGRLKNSIQSIVDLQRYLNQTITFEEAKTIVADRMGRREENFLSFVKRHVYDNLSSPYLPLLQKARCSYDDMVYEVRRNGIEALLRLLLDSGVRVSFDEFKGHKPLHRGGDEYRLKNADFDNPLSSPGVKVKTGGTSGRPIHSNLYLDFLADRACYDQFLFNMLDIYDAPLVLWYPKLPASTGISNSLRYAKIGHPPDRWFSMQTDSGIHSGFKNSLTNLAIVWLSRLTKTPLPRPQALNLSRIGVIVDWIIETRKRHTRCVVQCYVSQAVRICQAAMQREVDLEGTIFIVGSEPLTEAKHTEIEKMHARVFPRYQATEIGSVATGCGQPSEVGELHLHSDTIAMIQTDTPRVEGAPKPFYLTSFLNTAPKIMINVELGDSGIVQNRRCGCLLDEIGFNTHLLQVHSFSRATSEGMSLCYNELKRITENLLPFMIGGSSTDYQWVEVEDDNSFTRLLLYIDPGVGPVAEDKTVKEILKELRQVDLSHRLQAEVWRQAKTIKIVRLSPLTTSSGKRPSFINKHARSLDSRKVHEKSS